MFAAGSFLFNGAIFVSSAAFNNLGFPTYSTVFNWGRSTLGVIPFVWAGAHYYGADGVIAGRGLGAVVFGIVSMIVCFRTVIARIGKQPPPEDAAPVAAAGGQLAVLDGQGVDAAIALVVSRACRCACAGVSTAALDARFSSSLIDAVSASTASIFRKSSARKPRHRRAQEHCRAACCFSFMAMIDCIISWLAPNISSMEFGRRLARCFGQALRPRRWR